MCSKQSRRFKSKCVQHDYKNKRIETLTNHISSELKGNLMKLDVIQINGGITINVDVSVKNIIHVKKNIIFGILLHVVAKMENV